MKTTARVDYCTCCPFYCRDRDVPRPSPPRNLCQHPDHMTEHTRSREIVDYEDPPGRSWRHAPGWCPLRSGPVTVELGGAAGDSP